MTEARRKWSEWLRLTKTVGFSGSVRRSNVSGVPQGEPPPITVMHCHHRATRRDEVGAKTSQVLIRFHFSPSSLSTLSHMVHILVFRLASQPLGQSHMNHNMVSLSLGLTICPALG